MQSGMQYWLAPHVYLCRVRDAVVFLDLERGKYTAISGKPVHALGAVVAGWPGGDSTPAGGPNTSEYAEQTAERLVAQGLLTRDAAQGKSAVPVSLHQIAELVFVGMDLVRSRRIRIGDIVRFLLAWRWAVRAQWRPMSLVAQEIAAHKQRGRTAIEPEADRTVELVCVFRRLRTLTFTAHGRCLLHALMLMNFLYRYGIFPTWVIGVRTLPWGAHSWVQQGPLILDFDPSEVGNYTPILAV